jgi:glycosyltransferase involved in cell wall biosynthesis
VFPEAAGDAAVYVDPENPDEIGEGICRVLFDLELGSSLRKLGLERAKLFTWDICAAKTLALFESVAAAT